MERTVIIYKYPLPIGEMVYGVDIPKGARVLSCGVDAKGEVVVWAEVDTDAPIEKRFFDIVPTGQQVSSTLLGRFIGTVSLNGAAIILHIYDDRKYP